MEDRVVVQFVFDSRRRLNCLLVRRVVCGRLAWITNYGSKKILEQMELTLDLLGLYV